MYMSVNLRSVEASQIKYWGLFTSICLSRLPRSINDSNSEADLTGVASEDATGACLV